MPRVVVHFISYV